MRWYLRVAVLALLAWYGCTMTTDLPDVGNGAASSSSVGQGGSENRTCNSVGDCVDRCALLECASCNSNELLTPCADLTRPRAECICSASTCSLIEQCLERECFDENDCSDGGTCDSTGKCDPVAMQGASSTGSGSTNLACCSPHMGAGCDSSGCERCVCTLMPGCCADSWTQQCADQAIFSCGQACGCDG